LAAVSRHLAVLIAAVALAGCGGSSAKGGSATDTPAPAATPDVSNGCGKAEKPVVQAPGKLGKPRARLSAGKTYVATVATTCGDFEITLDAKRAPKTGGSFKYLADKRFFDDLSFHRIVADFVIQGGDPKGDGSGGPGYTVVEAPPTGLVYKKGIVAMAKTQTDPTGASGSQFFVVTGGPGSQAEQLTPDYALLGTVTKGMDVVDKIGGIQSDANTGQPAWVVVIKSIRVTAK
jgi:cyclophilin family peptidyl-prolyl cis-trans isomerase